MTEYGLNINQCSLFYTKVKTIKSLNVNVIYLNAYGTNMELPTHVRTASFRGGLKGTVVPTLKS